MPRGSDSSSDDHRIEHLREDTALRPQPVVHGNHVAHNRRFLGGDTYPASVRISSKADRNLRNGPGPAQAEAGAVSHRQPCSAASQPQRPLQAQSVAAAGNAFAGLAWQPQQQVLPGQGLQGHEVSRWFMSSSEGWVANQVVRAMNSAERSVDGLERSG
jgi:hypothetical protein